MKSVTKRYLFKTLALNYTLYYLAFMQNDKVQKTIADLDNVISCVRNQNSGADVHTVNNIHHTAQLLIEQLKDDPECMQDELVDQIVRNIHDRLTRFYQEKYFHK